MRASSYWLTLITCTLLQFGCASNETAPPVTFIAAEQLSAPGAVLPATGYVASGQPDAAALGAAAAAGYVAVVDLRTPPESRGFDEEGTARSLGMQYISLPVAGAEGVSYENASKLDAILAEIDGPVLVHCGSGNRVGALFALRAKADGATDEEALAVGRAAGLTSLETTVRTRLEAGE